MKTQKEVKLTMRTSRQMIGSKSGNVDYHGLQRTVASQRDRNDEGRDLNDAENHQRPDMCKETEERCHGSQASVRRQRQRQNQREKARENSDELKHTWKRRREREVQTTGAGDEEQEQETLKLQTRKP